MKKILFAASLTLSAAIVMAQGSASLILTRNLHLPKDSVLRAGLLTSLEGWLGQRGQPDSLNAYLSHDAATSVFMDELRSIDRSINRDSAAGCRCYLGNVVSLDSGRCLVQLNYMEVRKDTPLLRACCIVLASRGDDNRWMVSSLLEENTSKWKTKKIGNCVFHYKDALNARKAAAFVRQIASYDNRLHVVGATLDFYTCDNLLEATRLVGEDYRSDYDGLRYYELSEDYGNRTVVVSGEKRVDGFNSWDTHDWWHARLHRLVPVATIYRPVDEGMAYLYGGSWRVYSWKDVLGRFKDYAAAHPDADWLALYKSGVDYLAERYNLKISYVINALIVQRLEKEKGFDAALPLVTCGPKQEGDANYFAALKQATGVDRAGFNGYVADLLAHAGIN
jgi:hypothetical protein